MIPLKVCKYTEHNKIFIAGKLQKGRAQCTYTALTDKVQSNVTGKASGMKRTKFYSHYLMGSQE